MRGLRYALVIMVWACLLGTITPVFAQPERAPLGMNLGGVVSYMTDWPFVDVFRTARPWISNCEGCDWDGGGALDLTAEGWVASLKPNHYADTVMMDGGVPFPEGDYVILYDGDGQLDILFNTAAVVSQSAGRMVITTPSRDGLWLRIAQTNPADPLRNIRVILPRFEASYASDPFHPLYLERLAGFSVVRFMDWMATNNSPIQTWDERPQLTDATWGTERGVPVEVMVDLANRLGADPWFTLPHQADDDYVRQFAITVRDTLAPDRKVYIEYSNETWNSIFSQAAYVIERGRALGLSDNDFQAGLFYHSRRAVEIFAIWEEVFGGTDRLVRVLAAQAANPWTSEQVASFEQAYRHADAIAIAPYFGHSHGDPAALAQTLALTPEALIDALRQEVQTETRAMIEGTGAVASQFGLAMVAYEGGQHLAGFFGAENDDALNALFFAANRHPAMGDLYLEYLALWNASGGGVFSLFSYVGGYSKWGSWGVLEYLSQPVNDAPKYQALRTYLGN